jgi:dTDP-N-acetylfucosamine:lipid II N-acetylfucosaminyltransferase
MRILHIFPVYGYVFTKDYIRFIGEYFGLDHHSFTVIGNTKSISGFLFPPNLKGIKYFEKYTLYIIKIERYFLKFDKLIFHSLDLPPIIMLLFMLNPSLMNKIVWVEWGYDLYNWRVKDPNLKSKIENAISYSFRKRIKYFVGIFPPDIELFKKEFNSDAQTFYARYYGGLYNPLFKKQLNLVTLAEKTRNKDCINIQVGHSCDPSLNHFKVLDDLLKFKDENIKVYIPLSYGDKEIGDQIEEKGKLLFGDKAICIRRIMDKDKYMDFLASIDIAIFNTQRQIGLGNLSPLRYLEKKIFIPAGSVMFEHFVSQGISICDYNKIEMMDFRSFTEPVDMKKAKELIKSDLANVNVEIERWRKVFDIPVKQGY